ncbi:hypothetical protein MNBD_NITROSPINAE05-377, partial [hydrothermal vent metagenome]
MSGVSNFPLAGASVTLVACGG